MKKLFSWTETDGKNQTLTIAEVPKLETLETCDRAGWKSALRPLTPAAYADVLVQRPLPLRRHRIPIGFLGRLPQEKEQSVPIRFGPCQLSPEKGDQKRLLSPGVSPLGCA